MVRRWRRWGFILLVLYQRWRGRERESIWLSYKSHLDNLLIRAIWRSGFSSQLPSLQRQFSSHKCH